MPGVLNSVLLQDIADVRYQSLSAHYHSWQLPQAVDN